MKRVPDLFLGAMLAIAIFAIGVVFGGLQYSGSTAENQSQNETKKTGKSHEYQKNWWNDPVADFTLGLVVVGLFQVGLFYVQLRLIRESLDDAKIAADAAKESADAAKKSADTSAQMLSADRAWITIDSMPIFQASDGRFADKPFKTAILIRVVWRNRGRSPALDTAIFGTCKVVPIEETVAPHFTHDPPETIFAAPVGPDATALSSDIGVVDEDRDAVFARTKVIVVYSIVKYRDIFNPAIERTSEICMRVMFNGFVEDRNTGRRGPQWTIGSFGQQNTAT